MECSATPVSARLMSARLRGRPWQQGTEQGLCEDTVAPAAGLRGRQGPLRGKPRGNLGEVGSRKLRTQGILGPLFEGPLPLRSRFQAPFPSSCPLSVFFLLGPSPAQPSSARPCFLALTFILSTKYLLRLFYARCHIPASDWGGERDTKNSKIRLERTNPSP